jgi:anti-anti-sigma regulatory factor/anti-sigma regulatory factor (Ser/Thr protein kinase)
VPARIECVAESRFPVSVVRVVGTLDTPAAASLGDCLFAGLADQPMALVLDLSGVSVADESALTQLPALARRAAQWPGVELVLCAPDPALADALDRLGVTWVCRDRQEALAVAASQPAPPRLQRHLLPVADAPRQARELVGRAATAWRLPAGPAQVAQVIATELVTNGVRHAGTPMNFSVVLRNGYLHVAVRDGVPNPPRRRTVMTERDDHGRGLQLVDGLAGEWGCMPMPDGKVVWARVPVG